MCVMVWFCCASRVTRIPSFVKLENIATMFDVPSLLLVTSVSCELLHELENNRVWFVSFVLADCCVCIAVVMIILMCCVIVFDVEMKFICPIVVPCVWHAVDFSLVDLVSNQSFINMYSNVPKCNLIMLWFARTFATIPGFSCWPERTRFSAVNSI